MTMSKVFIRMLPTLMSPAWKSSADPKLKLLKTIAGAEWRIEKRRYCQYQCGEERITSLDNCGSVVSDGLSSCAKSSTSVARDGGNPLLLKMMHIVTNLEVF